jgi:hypothetical protein
VDSETFHALVNPDRTLATIVLAPQPVVEATPFMSAINVKHGTYTKSVPIICKVNIACAPVPRLTPVGEVFCTIVFVAADWYRPEPVLQVRFETFGGQCLCLRSKSLKSLKLKNVAPVLLRRSL